MKLRLLLISSVLLLAGVFSYSSFAAEENEREGNPLDRMKYFYERRAYPFERIPDNAYIEAREYMKRSLRAKNSAAQILAQQPAWRQIGPNEVGGRVRSVVIHPTQPGTVFIGAASGGVWKTTDEGQSWTPTMDFENSCAMGALAIDPNNPDVLFAATGEMVGGSTFSIPGAGVYKTTDAGKTWNSVGLTTVGAFCKIYVHPKNSSLVYAGGAFTNGGFYKSNDGGKTWKRTYDGTVSDVSINPDDENEIFIGVTGESVFRSNNAGETWTRLDLTSDPVGRISVQQSVSDKGVVYVLAAGEIARNADGSSTQNGYVFKSLNQGQSWTRIWSSANIFCPTGNPQGGYDNFIAVHPTNPNIVLVGGVNLYRCADGGKSAGSWYEVAGYNTGNHPDMHCAAFDLTNPNIVYLGNDGGMHRSTDAGDSWRDINNGLSITQFHDLGVDNKSDKNYGGTQDNGTVSNASDALLGGDGGFVAIDPTNSNIIYAETQEAGAFGKINLANGQFTNFAGKKYLKDDPGYWAAPFMLDPLNPRTIYAGRSALYISDDAGNNWFPASPSYGGKITAIGVSSVDPAVIYTGTTRGELAVTNEGGGVWTNITGLPARFVSDIVPSYNDLNTAYVALSGFRAAHVYKTTDLGKNWTDIGKGLPDVPVNALVIHPDNENIIFIGTDVGVFGTYDGGQTWFPFGTGLPSTMIIDLEFYMPPSPEPGKLTLRAATHGRSMWEIDIPSEVVTEPEITAPIGGEIFIAGDAKDVSWYGFAPPVTVEYTLDDGKTWSNIADGATGNSLKFIIPSKPTYLARVRVTSNTDKTQTRTSRTFTIIEKYTGLVLQNSGVNYIPYGIAFDGKDGLWTTTFDKDTSIGGRLYKLNANTLVMEKSVKITQGDSLFTDLTFDRSTGEVYMHKITSTLAVSGGTVYVMDTNGVVKRSFKSPATIYPIGLEMVNGSLFCVDRDGGTKYIYKVDPQSGNLITRYKNPFQSGSGPRCLCSDPAGNLFQVSTNFGGGSLTNAYALKMASANPALEISRFELTYNTSPMNARGIEYDPRDKNFWISTYEGAIYKVAGLEIASGVDESGTTNSNDISNVRIHPNPANGLTYVAFTPQRNAERATVRIVNLLGATVATIYDGQAIAEEQNILKFEANNLMNGIYTVVITLDNRQSTVEKLIINR